MKNFFLYSALLFIFGTAVLTAQTGDINEEIQRLFRQGKYDDIIFKAHNRTDELNKDALFELAISYINQVDTINGYQYLQKSLDAAGDDPEQYYKVADVYSQVYRDKKARYHLWKALEIAPDSSKYMSEIAVTFATYGSYDSALYYYKKALELKNPDKYLHLHIANIYFDMDDYENAVPHYYRAAKLFDEKSPETAEIYYNLAVIDYDNGNYVDAEKKLAVVLTVNARNYLAIEKLIQVLYKLERYSEGDSLKEILYKSYMLNTLPEKMRNLGKFCIDQFYWHEWKVLVFEQYAYDEGKIMNAKLSFYLLNQHKKPLVIIQATTPPSVAYLGDNYIISLQDTSKEKLLLDKVISYSDSYLKIRDEVKEVLDKYIDPETVEIK